MNRKGYGAVLLALFVLDGTLLAQVTWRRSYGGHGNDQARCVEQTADGGYIVAGSTGSFGEGGDVYVLKLNGSGDVEWSNYYGAGQVDEAWAIAEVGDGFLVAGTTLAPSNGGYDGLLLRLGMDGQLIWRRNYGGADWDMFYGMDLSDTGIFLVGVSYDEPAVSGQVWVVHTDMDGEHVWSTSGGGGGEDMGHAIRATPDGGCVAVGTYSHPSGDTDAYLLKLDGNGELEFETTLGTDSLDRGYGVDRSADGSFVLCGYTHGFQEYSQILVGRVSAEGDVVQYDHLGQGPEWQGRAIREKPDGTLAVAAFTTAYGAGGRDMFLLITDPDCHYLFGTTYGGLNDDEAFSIALTSDGGYVLAGHTDTYAPGPQAVFVVKAGPDGFTASESVHAYFDPVGIEEERVERPGPVAYPNPARPGELVHVSMAWGHGTTVRLHDASGRLLLEGPLAGNTFTLPELAEGWYLLGLDDRAGNRVRLPILLRR